MIDHMTPRDVPKTLPGTRPQDIESTQCEFARAGVPKTDVSAASRGAARVALEARRVRDSLRFKPLFHISIKLANQARPLASCLVDLLRKNKPFKGLNAFPDVFVGTPRDGIVPND